MEQKTTTDVSTSPQTSPKSSQSGPRKSSAILDLLKKFLPASLLQAIVNTESRAQELFVESVSTVGVRAGQLGRGVDALGADQRRQMEEFGQLLANQMPSAASHIDNANEKLKDNFQKDV